MAYITPIAKSDVAAHAIGAPVTLPDANGRAQAMLADLLYTRGDASSDAPAAPPAVAFDCTPCPRPRLKGVSWRHGGDGGALQAAGTGLGRSGKLTLDGKRLHVDSWSPTAIAFRLGQSSASGKLVADCGRASNALDLAVPSPPPATGQLEAGGSAVAIRARSRVFRLDAGLSHDTDGTVVSWRWHAEHGRLIGANNRSAVYVMASPPKATVVKLTITDDHQRTATAQVPVRPGAAIVQISTAVLFKTGSSQLTAEGRVHLRGLRTDVDGARSLRVVGHTDAVGSEAHNRGLAKRRAAAVYAYLTRGIERPPSRRPPLARGETRPIATNETPAGRALNRRVTILIRLMPPSA